MVDSRRLLPLLILLSSSCFAPVETDDDDDRGPLVFDTDRDSDTDTDTDADTDTDTDTDADTDADTDTDTDTDEPEDVDRDGYSEAEGDCDDGDADVYPGATETCNGVDDDCDGRTDEDADGDPYEPNDSSQNATYFGELMEIHGGTMEGWIFEEGDEDWIMFYGVDDTDWGLDGFFIDLTLSPPGAVDIAMDIYHAQEGTTEFEFWETVDERGAGGTETYYYGGWSGFSDDGYYLIRIYGNSGEDCRDGYLLKFEGGS